MTQENTDAVKLYVSHAFEWISRSLQILLVALIFWFGSEVVELRTAVAVLTERIERYGLLSVQLDRLQAHIEAVDNRVRDLEREIPRAPPLPRHLSRGVE